MAPFCPRFEVGNVVRLFLPTSSNAAYSLARIGILLCPHEDGQEQCLSWASIAFLYLLPSIELNQHSGVELTTVFSSCWLLPSLTHHALEQWQSVNKWRRQAFACRLFQHEELFSEGQKNLVNSENNENLSYYQLLRQKPSLWSISLHLSTFLTIVQLYFAWHRFLQWFQLKFRAGNFPGRDRVRVHCACSHVWPRLRVNVSKDRR